MKFQYLGSVFAFRGSKRFVIVNNIINKGLQNAQTNSISIHIYIPGLVKNILWSQYIVQYIILYNIIKFIVKENIILYIYYCKKFHNILTIYCKPAYPISVNIKALQVQTPKLSNNIIINSSTTKIEIE